MAGVKSCNSTIFDKMSDLSYKPESSHKRLNIPLKFVYISSIKGLHVVNNDLFISKDNISFKCFPKPDTFKVSNVDINCKFIKAIQYSKEENLLRIYIKSDAFSNLFYKRTEDEVFVDTIWFCLNIIDDKTFSLLLDFFRDNYLSHFNVSTISPIMLNKFINKLRKAELPIENISVRLSMVLDNNLVTTFKEIKLTPLPNNMLPLHTTTDTISDSNENSKIKKRKLKRSFDLPVIKTKKPKIIPSVGHKLLYSPSPEHSIEISYRDLVCLAPKKYLNDNIINLYLAYIYHEILTKKQQKASYFFNVFFNTKLIGTASEQAVDTAETRHSRVAKWTKNVDIFSKDFIVIPVIEDGHWFLVIVCFPWMAGIIDYSQSGDTLISTNSTIPTNESTFAKNIRIRKRLQIEQEDNINPMPCILVFDSLNLKNRLAKVTVIREYLKSEWDSKRLSKDGALIFDKTTCRGFRPNVPTQDNSTDCGLYLLQYVESFFKKPFSQFNLEFFKKDLDDWFGQEFIEGKRALIKTIIDTKTKEILPDENDDDDAVKFVNVL